MVEALAEEGVVCSPMAKYRRLRDRVLEERILSHEQLHVPDAIAWHDLLLVHDAEYVDAVARGTLALEVQRNRLPDVRHLRSWVGIRQIDLAANSRASAQTIDSAVPNDR